MEGMDLVFLNIGCIFAHNPKSASVLGGSSGRSEIEIIKQMCGLIRCISVRASMASTFVLNTSCLT